MGVQPPPGNATSLLQPISKALCEMIDKEIGALREDTEDALLKVSTTLLIQRRYTLFRTFRSWPYNSMTEKIQ